MQSGSRPPARRMVTGDEYDALTRWRHVLHWRPGARAQVKRGARRRERRERRAETQRADRDD